MTEENDYWFHSAPKTKIVCTIGPASQGEEILLEMIRAGMSVARLNMSHGDINTHKRVIDRVRSLSRSMDVPVGIMVDVPGAKYRIGPLAPGAVNLGVGDTVVLTSSDIVGNQSKVGVTPPGIHHDAKLDGIVLVDDGNMEFKVIGIEDNDVRCRVIRGGRLTERRGVATPGKAPSQEFPDDKAKECLAFAAEHEADFVALSTITSSDDIKNARRILLEKGMKTPFIISKVERAEAIENIAEIVDESDALMVARGDMGVEVPLKRVPVIQKDLIRRSNRAGKPVITATQMLESMVSSSSPTRAEVTDVANAVYDGTDAVMLSGETSIGDFPVESVQFMADVAREAEVTLPYESSIQNEWRPLEAKTDDAISFAACQVADQIDAGMIVAFTESGISAGRVSRYRPRAKILALTPNKEIQRMLSLRWGVFPVIVDGVSDVEDFFLVGEQESKKILGNRSYAQVVLVAGTPIGVPGSTNLLRVLELGKFD